MPGSQSWPFYIGSKRGSSKLVRTGQFRDLFPEGGVVWKIPLVSIPVDDCLMRSVMNVSIYGIDHTVDFPSAV